MANKIGRRHFECVNTIVRIVGEEGTVYNASYVDETYAHVDEGIDNPGYLTAS